MTITYYEMIFNCTETLQNGKERTIKKSVLSPIFSGGRHIREADRIQRCIDILKQEHYYNIIYVATKKKALLFADFD